MEMLPIAQQNKGLYPYRPMTYPTRGIVLQSVPAFTHAYDQNQRHVRALNIRVTSNGGTANALVTFDVPASPVIIPGVHYLFLVSAAGVPSVARFAVVG